MILFLVFRHAGQGLRLTRRPCLPQNIDLTIAVPLLFDSGAGSYIRIIKFWRSCATWATGGLTLGVELTVAKAVDDALHSGPRYALFVPCTAARGICPVKMGQDSH